MKGAEDGVHGVESVAQEADLFPPCLGGEKKVVDVDVHAGERGGPDGRGGESGGARAGREGRRATGHPEQVSGQHSPKDEPRGMCGRS